MPWGGLLAELTIGKERGFAPINELHAKLWTTKYPTSAVLPLAALTKLAYATPVEAIAIPALFIFSDDDKVVRPELTREIAGRWGAQPRAGACRAQRRSVPPRACRRRAVAGNDAGAGRPHRSLGEGGGGVSGEGPRRRRGNYSPLWGGVPAGRVGVVILDASRDGDHHP